MDQQKLPKLKWKQKLKAFWVKLYFKYFGKFNKQFAAFHSNAISTKQVTSFSWTVLLYKVLDWLERHDPIETLLNHRILQLIMTHFRTLLVVYLAYVLADLSTQSIAILSYGNSDYQFPHVVRSVVHPLVPKPLATYMAIVRDNYFCPGCDEKKLTQNENEKKDCHKVSLSKNKVDILASIVMENPVYSLVTLRLANRKEGIFKIGEDIPQLGKLVAIIRNGFCFVSPGEDWQRIQADGDKLPQVMVTNNLGSPLIMSKVPPSDRYIKNDGRGNFSIDKKYKDEMLQTNFNQIIQQAKAIPEFDPATGEIKCWKMTQVISDSVIEKLGIENGDCIITINGMHMPSQGKALEVFTQLKNASQISVEFERNGIVTQSKFDIK